MTAPSNVRKKRPITYLCSINVTSPSDEEAIKPSKQYTSYFIPVLIFCRQANLLTTVEIVDEVIEPLSWLHCNKLVMFVGTERYRHRLSSSSDLDAWMGPGKERFLHWQGLENIDLAQQDGRVRRRETLCDKRDKNCFKKLSVNFPLPLNTPFFKRPEIVNF